MEVLYGFGIGGSLLAGLEVSFLFSFVHCRVGVFTYGLHVGGRFCFVVFRLVVSFVVSTHSTDVISLHSFPGDWHGQGQRVLAEGISRCIVVAALVSS